MAARNPLDDSRYISDLVRTTDRDRYLSTILAPAHKRVHLFALHGLDLELQAIPDRTTEPLAAEIRVQWWRDWLQSFDAEPPSGNPIADALGTAIAEGVLQKKMLLEFLDAWSHVFHSNLAQDESEAEDRMTSIDRPFFVLAMGILDETPDRAAVDLEPITKYAGYIRLLKNIGKARASARHFLTEKQMDLPVAEGASSNSTLRLVSALGEKALAAREHANIGFIAMPSPIRPSMAFLAAIGPELRCGQVGASAARKMTGTINPLKHQWRIWRAVQRGRL